jgi:DnaK suppressor protein
MATSVTAAPKGNCGNELKHMLEDHRHQLVHEVKGSIRDVRHDSTTERTVADGGENAELGVQQDIAFALIQLKAETLNAIDAALHRLEDGSYGDCFDCGGEIAEARLRALPFTVRCIDCERARETLQQRERIMGQRRGSSSVGPEMSI